MGLFKRTQQPAPTPAPKRARARKSEPLTYGELEDALATVRAAIWSESSAARTLGKLDALTVDYASARQPVKLDALGPVSAGELAEAIAELQEIELPANAVSVLKRMHGLLENAEKQAVEKAASEPPNFVSQAQLEDVFAALGAFVGCAAEEFSKTQFQKSELIAHLSQTAARAAPRVRPYLRRLVDAVCEYREPAREPESYADRMYRAHFGTSRPRHNGAE